MYRRIVQFSDILVAIAVVHGSACSYTSMSQSVLSFHPRRLRQMRVALRPPPLGPLRFECVRGCDGDQSWRRVLHAWVRSGVGSITSATTQSWIGPRRGRLRATNLLAMVGPAPSSRSSSAQRVHQAHSSCNGSRSSTRSRSSPSAASNSPNLTAFELRRIIAARAGTFADMNGAATRSSAVNRSRFANREPMLSQESKRAPVNELERPRGQSQEATASIAGRACELFRNLGSRVARQSHQRINALAESVMSEGQHASDLPGRSRSRNCPAFGWHRWMTVSGGFRGHVNGLKLARGQLAEAALATPAVVLGLDPGHHHRQAQLLAGPSPLSVQNVLLKQLEERLHRGVVSAGSVPAYRPDQTVAFQDTDQSLGTRLTAPVEVHDRAGRVTQGDRVAQR